MRQIDDCKHGQMGRMPFGRIRHGRASLACVAAPISPISAAYDFGAHASIHLCACARAHVSRADTTQSCRRRCASEMQTNDHTTVCKCVCFWVYLCVRVRVCLLSSTSTSSVFSRTHAHGCMLLMYGVGYFRAGGISQRDRACARAQLLDGFN